MAGDEGDKDEIARGMSESGKDAGKAGQGAGGSDEIARGMSGSGSGAPTAAEGSGGGPAVPPEERPDRPRDEAAGDDAIDDSFPASDPPAWTSDTGAGTSKGS